jgi:hypothetical protein
LIESPLWAELAVPVRDGVEIVPKLSSTKTPNTGPCTKCILVFKMLHESTPDESNLNYKRNKTPKCQI